MVHRNYYYTVSLFVYFLHTPQLDFLFFFLFCEIFHRRYIFHNFSHFPAKLTKRCFSRLSYTTIWFIFIFVPQNAPTSVEISRSSIIHNSGDHWYPLVFFWRKNWIQIGRGIGGWETTMRLSRHSVQDSVKSARLSAAVVLKWVECSQRSRIEFVSWVPIDQESSRRPMASGCGVMITRGVVIMRASLPTHAT